MARGTATAALLSGKVCYGVRLGVLVRHEAETTEADLKAAREIAIEVWTEAYVKLQKASALEAEIMDEAHDIAEFAFKADTRTATILLVSFLEDALKKVFVEHWSIVSKKDHDRYFGGAGPLSTFSQRALVAGGLKWLAPEQISELDILRRIRNTFAHSHRVHSLGDEQLAGLVTSLAKREEIWCRRDRYRHAYEATTDEIRYRMRVFCVGFSNVSAILANAKILRAQIPARFRPRSGWDGMMDAEQALADASIRFCWQSLGLGYSGATYVYQRDLASISGGERS